MSSESENPISSRLDVRKVIREWLPLVLMVLFILVARSSLADHYHVPSGSMEHALTPGDHVLVHKAAYGLRVPFTKQVIAGAQGPERGDVVIFDSPVDGTRLIKRVVALGGEEVSVRQGRVLINGVPLAVDAAGLTERMGSVHVELNLKHGGGPELPPMVVPDGHVLVLGDHRGNSRDGRYFGTVPNHELYGRALGIFWGKEPGPTWKSL